VSYREAAGLATPPVDQAAADQLRFLAVHELFGGPVRVVDEQHLPVGLHAVAHQRPEGLEALERDVRDPKAEEHHVVSAVG
jgi:hypothetical protein